MLQPSDILAPIDFSSYSDLALRYAIEQCKRFDATLHLVHVVEPAAYPADWGYSQVGFVDLETELVNSAEKELKKLYENVNSMGIKAKTAVLRGKASSELVEYANENSIGLICISTHGRGGLEHLLFGSTTERILRKSQCPVLAIKKSMVENQ